MTIHRFFVSSGQIKNNKVFFAGDSAKQITKVLRLKIGDKVIVLDNSGFEFLVKLQTEISGQVIGNIIKRTKNHAEPKTVITLYQALTSREKIETILQKCTEIGVSKFVPVETKRSLLKVKDIKTDRLERFKKIIQEAAEQSERGLIPEISKPVKFEEAIIKLGTQGLALCAWEEEKQNKLSDILAQDSKAKKVSIFIGPEGGFEKNEIIFAKKHRVVTIGLGPRILRTETASPLLVGLILYAKGDLDDTM